MSEIFSSSQPEIILGSVGSGGGGNSPGLAGASAMLESFPFDRGGWIGDSAGDLWNIAQPKLSFVNVYDISKFTQLFWFEQYFGQNAGFQTGNMSLWGSLYLSGTPVKLYDGGILDGVVAPNRYTFTIPLNLAPYQLLIFVSDGALSNGNGGYNYVSQSKIFVNDSNPGGQLFPDSAYLGIHLGGSNTAYSAIPVIPSNAVKFYMAMWNRIGVS
jgi:hypothetical protein